MRCAGASVSGTPPADHHGRAQTRHRAVRAFLLARGARSGGGPVPDVRSTPPSASEPDPGNTPRVPVTEPKQVPADPYKPPPHWQQWQTTEPAAWLARVRPDPPAGIRAATLWSVLATALLSALLLGDGLGLNLLIVSVPAALAAYFAARTAGRRLRPWTLVWAVGGLVLLAVPALRDAGWPTFLATVGALAAGSLALHGGRTWPGVLLGSLGLLDSIGSGVAWGVRGLRERADTSRGRWGPVVRTTAVAAVLLVVFGALFAGADAAFADLLGGLIPDVSVEDGPWRLLLFLLGLIGALAAAHTAAAPVRWDRLGVRPGRARGRWEWALPLVVLNLLFAAFIAVQLAVLFGGYDKVLKETGLTYAEYARQGFWQLLWATLLTLLVIALALRWAPRGGGRDRTLVRAVLGALCVLTLVVVASALRRMDLYVDAYGLTRLRISVAAMELWLGLVIVLILAAGAFGAKWLPRAVATSAAAAVLVFGLLSPDGMVAERNVQRYERTGKIDIGYFQELSADAVPALDTLPEPLRSCALGGLARELEGMDKPWYATSWGERRARQILAERKVDTFRYACADQGLQGGERDHYDGDAEFEEDGEIGP
ncbi:DUF4173 domain-containing protein [Streptomyces lunaelactis]|nr:DUF4173 domain-containing protein [Streptomyces lunaelactis]NUK21825.1 DUF4173 domain-containing protein [Streptomyces lunaelactis]NUK56374.1 DUF4173 domain-containing protein [Streptomyces lunaelactis]NUK71648.1 DUF4173 domain-containing protein [Streptomyces lunaelactis]NUK82253.1 DUF4173 domain-containing protein [Streptomyces lunaelactis]